MWGTGVTDGGNDGWVTVFNRKQDTPEGDQEVDIGCVDFL